MGSRQDWPAIARSVIYYARTAVLVFAATMLLGLALALLMPAKYRSEARLLTLPADYYAVPGRDKTANGSAEAFKPEELANVEMQLLSSQDLQREVLLRLGTPARDPMALEQARKAFAKSLSIERVEGANVIELGYTARAPQEAAARLQKLLDVYFETRARVLTSGRSEMIARQRAAAERELAAADTALRSFQARNGIVDIQAQVNGAIAVDTALRQDLAATRADLSQTRGNASELRNASSRVPRTVELYRDDTEATKAIADMQSQILGLEAKRADLEGRYMQGSPLIEQVDKQIAGLRSAIDKQSGQLREARRVGRNTYYDAANDRLMQNDAAASGQAAKLGRLGQELSDSQLRLRNLNEVAALVTRLRTQRDVAEERFRSLTTQLEEARARELEAATGSTNVRVIQRPSLADDRSNPPFLLIAGSIVAGLALAAATLFVLILRRDSFLDAEEVAGSLHVPIVDLTQPVQQGGRAPALAVLRRPEDGMSGRGRVIALMATSAGDYDKAIARLLRLLETRFRQRVATVTFEETAYGWTAQRLQSLVPSQPGRARIKVGSRAWGVDRTGERLLASLRERHRCTVVIIPPADGTPAEDARRVAMAALADEVLLVVRTETTRRSAAENLAAALREFGSGLHGVVLTGRRIAWPQFLRSLR